MLLLPQKFRVEHETTAAATTAAALITTATVVKWPLLFRLKMLQASDPREFESLKIFIVLKRTFESVNRCFGSCWYIQGLKTLKGKEGR